MQLTELRRTLEHADPTDVLQMWLDLRASGADDNRLRLFAHVAEALMTEALRLGAAAIKQRNPKSTEGFATNQIKAASTLVATIGAWRESKVPGWFRAAKASRDLLRKCFRTACGVDARWLSPGEFSRLYLNGTTGNDPDKEPYKLARPDQIVTRFLPARLDK